MRRPTDLRGARRRALEAEFAPIVGGLGFLLLRPGWLPRGWRLDSVERVPGSRSMIMVNFVGPDDGWLRLTQRLRVVALREEADTVGHPYDVLVHRGTEYLVFGGARVTGEPVDGWHWHRTRQVVSWEHCDHLICEIEQRKDHGLSLRVVLRIARRLVPATPVFSVSPSAPPTEGTLHEPQESTDVARQAARTR